VKLQPYLDRIGYTGNLEPNLETLIGLHRAHLQTIPYENLEIHFGRTLGLKLERIFERLVLERRGGWCYEMNGLFAWVLREIGFDVRLVSASVTDGNGKLTDPGHHLALTVKLEKTWLVDVGWGNGFLDPLPLEAGAHKQGFLEYRIEEGDGVWKFHNQQFSPDDFTFALEPQNLEAFAQKCKWMQSINTRFYHQTFCHLFVPDGINTLHGAVLSKIRSSGKLKQTISSFEEYEQVLREDFKLEVPNLHKLWGKVWHSHLEWLNPQ
jgi:N-hydroxyarylamine O-acetyltransferase